MVRKSCLRLGYSMVEMMVVVAVIGMVGMVGFFGLRASDNSQKIDNIKNELLGVLRTTQNNALAGRSGARTIRIDFSTSGCTVVYLNALGGQIKSESCNLPVSGFSLSSVTPIADLKICFTNPNSLALTCSGSCSGSFGCNGNTPISGTVPLYIDGANSPQKTINISGSGIFVKRIYE